MAALSRQVIGKAGTAVTLAAANAGGDTLSAPTQADILIVENGDASPITVTLTVPGTNFAGTAEADTSITVGATANKYVRLDARYDNAGSLAIAYSAVTSVTVGVITT